MFDFDFVSSLDQEAVQEVGVGLELGAGLLLDDDRAKKSAGSKSGEVGSHSLYMVNSSKSTTYHS